MRALICKIKINMITCVMTSLFLQQSRSFADISVINDPYMLLQALNKFASDVSLAVNSRTIGRYAEISTSTGNSFNGTQTSRVVMKVPSILLGVTSITLPIQPSPKLRLVSLSGVASNGAIAIPLPYVNATAPTDVIELSFALSTATVSIITNTSNWVSYSASITAEYAYVV